MSISVMSEHRVAYRHANGEVEGFKGVGFGRARAKQDAMSQIARKLSVVGEVHHKPAEPFEQERLVETPKHALTRVQLNLVKLDWESGVRY